MYFYYQIVSFDITAVIKQNTKQLFVNKGRILFFLYCLFIITLLYKDLSDLSLFINFKKKGKDIHKSE